ncbi:MAG: tetratricopeptide repeat protein [Verrucomicrobia bacterium]|nr:tetratricopeptide repeat protein [Verrucomicrobiota bacterium]
MTLPQHTTLLSRFTSKVRVALGLLLVSILVQDAQAAASASSEQPAAEYHPPLSLPPDLVPPGRYVHPVAPEAMDSVSREEARLRQQFEAGRSLRLEGSFEAARQTLTPLLETSAPAHIHESTLLELGLVAEQEKHFTRAQQIYNQFHKHFPESAMAPEVMLRQGLMYRDMGAPTLAIAKFYAVGATALKVKEGDVSRYKRTVLQSQIEIAETHLRQGKYSEAADFLKRILSQRSADLDRSPIEAKLVQCYSALGLESELEMSARQFLRDHPDAVEIPEIRFLLADSLKRQGRKHDSLQELRNLLEEQSRASSTNKETWLRWQQRAGNEIANQLYNEGDYINALAVYEGILPLNSRPDWQLPLLYQIGLSYERLYQAGRAEKSYRALVLRAGEAGAALTTSLRPLVDMARWRADQVRWQDQARRTNAFFGASITKPLPSETPSTP